jgi:hypothetical protein
MTLLRMLALPMALLVAVPAVPAAAQEFLVTGQWRTGAPRPSSNAPTLAQLPSVIGLKRQADFIVQEVAVSGDTRDAATREREVYATVLATIRLARQSGLEVATDRDVLVPLTEATHRQLALNGTGRPDTSRAVFLIKLPVGPGVTLDAATARVSAFVKQVNAIGRTEVALSGGPSLSIVDPDRYRGQIVDLIAADAAAMVARFGPNQGVQVTGLDRAVQWQRTGPTEVTLYLPGGYTIVPAGR